VNLGADTSLTTLPGPIVCDDWHSGHRQCLEDYGAPLKAVNIAFRGAAALVREGDAYFTIVGDRTSNEYQEQFSSLPFVARRHVSRSDVFNAFLPGTKNAL
jgi:hypothetical protein